MELYELSIKELSELLKKKKISSVEATKSALKRIEQVEDKVKAYLFLDEKYALKQAEEADKRRAKGEHTYLLGVPLALKDIFLTKDMPTTCASKILYNFIPPFDGTHSRKLKEQGAVILGKLNMDEFAMGSSTERSGFFPSHNPWDLSRVPGGSSGGSAAAVCADECFGSLGTDTGGSIRQPAAFCGVVGIKPTYGRVSRFGMIAFASSLDQAGPITKTVFDSAIMLNAVSGYDPMDSTSVPKEVPDYTKACVVDIKGMKIGLPKEYFIEEGLDPDVNEALKAALRLLESLGAKVIEISLPHTEYSIAVYYIIAPAEASSNLARYDGVRYGLRKQMPGPILNMYKATRSQGFGPEVKRRILIGTYTLSAGYYDAYYRKAQQVRTLIKKDFEDAFKKCDVIITPTTPSPAFKLGEKTEDPLSMYLSDIFTVSCNLAGIAGMSIPCGFSREGLPIGMQILANHFEEEKIFRVAYTYEQSTDWHKRKPTL